MRGLIHECLRYKAEHNLENYGWANYLRSASHSIETASDGDRLGSS